MVATLPIQRLNRKASNAKYYAKNNARLNEYSRRYNLANAEKIKAYKRSVYDEKAAIKKKAYYLKNRRRILEQKKEYLRRKIDVIKAWRAANKRHLSFQNSRWHRLNRDKIRERKRLDSARRRLRPSERIAGNLRRRINKVILQKSSGGRLESLLGCSPMEFRAFIESQFIVGMGWHNYGRAWHIDHRLPCSSFDLTDEGQQKRCFHFSNMRPLWAKTNMRKGNRITEPQMRLLL